MNKQINTQNYSFSISLFAGGNASDCAFEIIANDKTNRKMSCITNLNFVLSEIVMPYSTSAGALNYETTIYTDYKHGLDMYNSAIRLFRDVEWLHYLYNKLEEDKIAGTWETA